MKITKTSVMHALLAYSEYGTIKVLEPPVLTQLNDFYGSDSVRKLRESGLYELDVEQVGDLYMMTTGNLSANIFETMPNILTEEELADYVAQYMKENGMWPTERPIAEIVRYTMEVALPKYVNAGLLEVFP